MPEMHAESDLMIRDSETVAASPGLVSIQIEPPPLMRLSLTAALLVIVFAVFLGTLLGSLIFQMPGLSALLAFLLSAIVALIVLLSRHDERRTKMEEIVSRYAESDHCAVVREFAQLWAWSGDRPTITLLPDMLAKRGLVGETLQVWWKAEPDPIEPLSTAFEVRILDEADAGFCELADAVEARGEQANSSTESAQTPTTDQLTIRRILRNIRLKGGWFMVVLFSLFSLIGFWKAFRRGSMTWSTLYWPVFLMMIMFMPVRKSPSSETQWLLLPGGLLLRKPTNRGKAVKLHLFDRRRSMLCLYPSRRKTWCLSVADAEKSEVTTITDRERRLLLRAWLSPVAPPPLEQLVDLS